MIQTNTITQARLVKCSGTSHIFPFQQEPKKIHTVLVVYLLGPTMIGIIFRHKVNCFLLGIEPWDPIGELANSIEPVGRISLGSKDPMILRRWRIIIITHPQLGAAVFFLFRFLLQIVSKVSGVLLVMVGCKVGNILVYYSTTSSLVRCSGCCCTTSLCC